MSINKCLFNDDALDNNANNLIKFLNCKIEEKYLCDFKETYLYGEEGITLENISMIIYEYKINLSKNIFNLFKDLCIDNGIDSYYWKDLENLIVI